jgi:hypothetical protein
MEPIKIGYEKPINSQSAMIFAKSPWWAMPPDEKKKEIIEAVEKKSFSVEELIETTKEPPGNITDKRGMIIGDMVIIGFADTRQRIRLRLEKKPHRNWVGPSCKEKQLKCDQDVYWWVVINGEIGRWGMRSIKKREKMLKIMKIAGIQNTNPKEWSENDGAKYRAAKNAYYKVLTDTI